MKRNSKQSANSVSKKAANSGGKEAADSGGKEAADSESKEPNAKVTKTVPKQKTLLDFVGFSGRGTHEIPIEKKAVICDFCGDIFGHKGALWMHVDRKHPKTKIGAKENVTEAIMTPHLLFTYLAPYLNPSLEESAEYHDTSDVTQNEPEVIEVESDDEKECSRKKDGPKKKSTRNSYSFKDKADYIAKYLRFVEENGETTFRDMAEILCVPKTLLQRWVSDKETIFQKAADDTLRNLRKVRPSTRHSQTHLLLLQEFRNARSRGKKVSFAWLWLKGKKIANEKNFPTFTRSGTESFIKKNKILVRRVQRSKQYDKATYEPKLKAFHVNYREKLIKSGDKKPHYDAKWGRFKPARRFNVDQVPLPFSFDKATTLESGDVGRYDRVWVAQPGSGLEKRQCTLQICFAPKDNHVRIEIIFRGTGKRISRVEKAAYHKDVDIYWQPKAWADTETSVEWVKKTLKPGVKASQCGNDEFVLLCDNLNAQTSDEFKKAVRKIGGIVWYGPPGATDIWQPVDAGYGKILKRLVAQEQDKWLEDDDNLDRWTGVSSQKAFSVSERRILITLWVGEAYKRLQEENYSSFSWNCFEKTGCLITADGTDDEKIKPEGLMGYKVLPPLPTAGPEQPPNDSPEPENDPEDEVECEDFENPSQVEQDEAENNSTASDRIDYVKDRTYEDILVGKRIRALYEDGWHQGMIDYFNTTFQQYHIEFNDSNDDDYITISDINGVDMVLIAN